MHERRILTSHVGSLVRPAWFIELLRVAPQFSVCHL